MTTEGKPVVNSTQSIVLESLNHIQREIEELQKLLGNEPVVRRSLRGLWEGVEFSDEDIEEAKHSWMKKIDDFEND